MAFPHDQDGAGDVKSLRRAAWASTSSIYYGIAGGSTLAHHWNDNSYGDQGYNWDQPEGFMRRINYHGSTEKTPFAQTSANGSIIFQNLSSLTSLARTNSSGDIITGTSARVIRIQNSTGNTNSEVYTKPYNNVPLTAVIAATPADGQWYLSFYAKKSSYNNLDTCTVTAFIFGSRYNSGTNTYSYSTGMTAQGVDASSSTISSPATGGSFYWITTPALTTTWTKYDMCFKFNGAANLSAITCRLDNDKGRASSHTYVYIDRVTLHPMNVAMTDVKTDVSVDLNMDDSSIYGIYS